MPGVKSGGDGCGASGTVRAPGGAGGSGGRAPGTFGEPASCRSGSGLYVDASSVTLAVAPPPLRYGGAAASPWVPPGGAPPSSDTGPDLRPCSKESASAARPEAAGFAEEAGAAGKAVAGEHGASRGENEARLCWLALLLIRVIENATGDTWRNVRHELDRMHLVTLATADGTLAQRSATTPGHKVILEALDLPEPPRFFDFTLPTE